MCSLWGLPDKKMIHNRIFYRFCLFCCLQLLYCCQVETKLYHLKQNGKVKAGGCQMENCGPPFDCEIIPNPPSVEKQFTILYGFKLVADVYKAFLHWSVLGPYGIHFESTTPMCVEHQLATALCPHVAGYYVHGNYTDHIPTFIEPGTPYSANLTLVNDEDVLIWCSRVTCTFDP